MGNCNAGHPMIISHRGYKAKYPENTLSAFSAVKNTGAHMIELDVTLSRDRKLAVIHDETIDRTTNGSGPVNQHTLSELKAFDAGTWFGPEFKDEKIPTLAQVLESVKGFLKVNIEIKPEAYEYRKPIDAVEIQVLDLLKKMKMTSDVIISSFDWRILENIRNMDSNVAIALLSESHADILLTAWCRWLGAFSWHPDYRVLSKDQVDRIHGINVKVFPYTVNTKKEIKTLLDMGVDGIITDDPTLFGN